MWLRCLCGLAVGVLQTAEAVRLRCLEAQELIGHLQTFSCHSAGSDFSKLPPIFTNDATLAEAAVSVALMHGHHLVLLFGPWALILPLWSGQPAQARARGAPVVCTVYWHATLSIPAGSANHNATGCVHGWQEGLAKAKPN